MRRTVGSRQTFESAGAFARANARTETRSSSSGNVASLNHVTPTATASVNANAAACVRPDQIRNAPTAAASAGSKTAAGRIETRWNAPRTPVISAPGRIAAINGSKINSSAEIASITALAIAGARSTATATITASAGITGNI